MPALNFKKQFAPDVESGKKRCSIRAKRKDGRNPHVGDRLYLYTGQRTKSCRKLGEFNCEAVTEIVIDTTGINLAGEWVNNQLMMNIVRADGFDSWAAFRAFFAKEQGLPFWGLLIEW
ncbi:MAG: ASCH domain-containing protein [Syntrophales bacterium LBB04]|nr:ASCH domain-containing protein [Syntrophales bacterium LBB04]